MASAWTPGQIAAATGCPEPNVWQHWPGILGALDRRGIGDRPVQLAAIATVAIETASTFEPVREAFWLDDAWRWANLRYAPHWGRGYVQLTWESNYRRYGDLLGVDLLGNPDLALRPEIAADVLAEYFNTHGGGPLIPEAARAGDWREVRRLVQGGADGLPRLVEIVTALDGINKMVTYDAAYPAFAQNDDWSCGPTALRWALHALGRRPSEQWIEQTMIAEGVVSREQGILDATGAGIAAFVTRQYGEYGYYANHEPSVSYQGAAREGDHAYPLLIGGRLWGHWSGLRGYDEGRNLLLLANPAPGYRGVQQTMSPQQFAALGPFSMVRILHPDLIATEPVQPTDPDAALLAEIKADMRAWIAKLDAAGIP